MMQNREPSNENIQSVEHPRLTSLNRIAIALLVATVFLAFGPTLSNDFVEWDDDHVIVNNEAYRGFSSTHLTWMFQTGFAGHYQPLTWLSYALDFRLWGLDPLGFHLTNLILHLIVSIGFYFIARRLLRATLPAIGEHSLTFSAFAAATLFAIHPLRVESVAWATERRDVLSGAWIMLTVALYLRAVGQSSATRRWTILSISALCYVLSLFSKAAGMPLPLVLVVLDYYPFRRIRSQRKKKRHTQLLDSEFNVPPEHCSILSGGQSLIPPLIRGDKGGSAFATKTLNALITPRQVLAEKLLFLIPAIAFAPVAVWAQNTAGALRSLEEHPLSLRISQAFYGLLFYPLKTLWPSNLVPLYEQRADASLLDTVFIYSAVIVITLFALVFALRRRYPALLAGTIVYLLWIAPVLGLAQSGPQIVADRYSYLSCMPWAILLGGLMATLWQRIASITRPLLIALTCATLAIATALIMMTRAQTRMWSDSFMLWSTTVERAPNTPTAHANLAILLNNRGEFERAKEHALTTLRFLPTNRSAHLALGLAYFELGDITSAEKHYRFLIEQDERTGRTDDGITAGLSIVLTRLAIVLNSVGRFDEAEALYRRAVEVKPTDAALQVNLAGFLASRDRDAEALDWLQRSLKIDPANAIACYRASVLLLEKKAEQEAITTLSQCLTKVPDDVLLNAQLALIFATAERAELRNANKAFTLAGKAMSLTNGLDPLAVEALSSAQAAQGNPRAAAATLDAILSNPEAALSPRARERLIEKREEYAALMR